MKPLLIRLIIAISLNPSYCYAEVSTKLLAYSCYSCHGLQLANIVLPQPITAYDLNQTLLAFKLDSNSASIMHRITTGFTDNELKAVANYITSSHQ